MNHCSFALRNFQAAFEQMNLSTWPESLQPWIVALRGRCLRNVSVVVSLTRDWIESIRSRMSQLLVQAYSSIPLQHVQLALGFNSAEETTRCKNEGRGLPTFVTFFIRLWDEKMESRRHARRASCFSNDGQSGFGRFNHHHFESAEGAVLLYCILGKQDHNSCPGILFITNEKCDRRIE